MSAAEFSRTVDLPNLGLVIVDSSETEEVWLSWTVGNARMYGFIPVAKARELAAALIEAADATDEATREAESGVKL